MNRLVFVSYLVLAALTAGCGDSEVDISEASPEEAAVEISDRLCERNVECGEPSISCTGMPDGNTVDCEGTIEDVNYDECVAELKPEIQSDFENCDLTPEQEQTVNDCVNALLAQDCITQAQLDEAVAMLEAGNEDFELGEIPPACEQVDAIFEGCSTPQ